jgi:hypothetical protein
MKRSDKDGGFEEVAPYDQTLDPEQAYSFEGMLLYLQEFERVVRVKNDERSRRKRKWCEQLVERLLQVEQADIPYQLDNDCQVEVAEAVEDPSSKSPINPRDKWVVEVLLSQEYREIKHYLNPYTEGAPELEQDRNSRWVIAARGRLRVALDKFERSKNVEDLIVFLKKLSALRRDLYAYRMQYHKFHGAAIKHVEALGRKLAALSTLTKPVLKKA